MAYKFLDVANLHDVSEPNEKAWECSESLAAASNGVSYIIPAGCNIVNVQLNVTAGSGKVQATLSPLALVKAGTEVWVDWSYGVVIATTQDSCLPPTAIRQVNISGTTVLNVRAQ